MTALSIGHKLREKSKKDTPAKNNIAGAEVRCQKSEVSKTKSYKNKLCTDFDKSDFLQLHQENIVS